MNISLFLANSADTHTVVIPLRQFGFHHLFHVKVTSHHVQFLHLITVKRPKMLEFGLIFVRRLYLLALKLNENFNARCLGINSLITVLSSWIIDQ